MSKTKEPTYEDLRKEMSDEEIVASVRRQIRRYYTPHLARVSYFARLA